MRSSWKGIEVFALSGLLAVSALAPAAGSELDFDEFPLGPFTFLTENGFDIQYIGYGDLQTVVEGGGGDLMLKDSNPANMLGAEIYITRHDGEPFLLNSLDACDLTGDPAVRGWTTINVTGYSGAVLLGADDLQPTSATPATFVPANVAGRSLTQLRIDIISFDVGSSPRDDFGVGALSLCTGPAMLDHDSDPLGTFTLLNEDGFSIHWIGYGDLQEVVDAGAGDLVLKDASPANMFGAEVYIVRDSGRPFLVEAIDACDFTGDSATNPLAEISVTGHSGSTLIGQDALKPTSTAFTTFNLPSLAGRPLTQLRIDIISIDNGGSPRDDFGVGDIDLILDPAVLDHDAHPLGPFVHLAENGYSLDHIGYGDLQEVVDLGGGDLALTDSNPGNALGAEIYITRDGGGTFGLEAIRASDLTGDPSFVTFTGIYLSGYRDGSQIAQDLVRPNSATVTTFAATNLACVTLDELRIDILSYEMGGPTGDNFAVAEILFTEDPAVAVDVPDIIKKESESVGLEAVPNPFRSSTIFRFSLSRPSPVRIEVFDVLGRRVMQLVDRGMPVGDHAVGWAGRGLDGHPVPAGVYFYRLETADVSVTRKVVRLN